jgi:hypothetical protein
VYDYEVDMFKQTLEICRTGKHQTLPHPIPNAIVESMLLHLRILTELLVSRGSDSDDIRLSDLLPTFTSARIAELKERYGGRKTVGSPCWTLNKMLAHPTSLRADTYSYDSVLRAMVPVIVRLLEEIAIARRAGG